jgi:hypothetical protein
MVSVFNGGDKLLQVMTNLEEDSDERVKKRIRLEISLILASEVGKSCGKVEEN